MKPASRPFVAPSENARALLEIGRSVIEHEAVLLEEQRWDEWLELYTPDSVYWVPAWRHDGVLATDPERELSLIYYASRAGLEDRILRIKSPNSPAGRRMGRTTHLLSNIRLAAEAGVENVELKASWATHIFSPRTNSTACFFGQVQHRLVREDGQWRIAMKKIILQNDYVPTLLDIYCL
ncbi:MAG: hypothetical protein JWR80_8145 [Bradyrhizobium sp.]|nr:hypothetical protein [Bradyrhizobium sp.]